MLDSPYFEVLGRLHPMVLHLPIGVLIALLVIEGLALVRRRPVAREVRLTLVWLGALCAVVSALSGLELSREHSYSHDGVWLHQWLGISVGVTAVACALLAQWGAARAYLGALVVCVGVLIPAGHFGAGLTHGDGFVLAPLNPAPVRKQEGAAPVRGEGSRIAEDPTAGGPIAGLDPQISAIFQHNCIGCHNSTKLKGGLALDTLDGLKNGGDGGAVVAPGNPDHSEMMMRLKLTPGDKEHMPPPGRTALTAEEVETLRKWIAGMKE